MRNAKIRLEMGYLGGSLEVLRRLAQEYGIDFDKGTDPVAILQELQRRAGSSGMGPIGGIFKELKRDIQSIPRKSRPLTQEVRYNAHRYRIWAVLIGIDAYEQYPLHGCVSDALLMKRFLTGDLGVPDNRIQCLLGPRDTNSTDPKSTYSRVFDTFYSILSKAPEFADIKSTPSRANIVDTLYSLANNSEISRGDNIIIYYAGHGSRHYCSTHGSESRCDNPCPIEALCPIDRDTQDKHGNWIPDISDRELNFLFKSICRAKGKNITFIADCCHSGGMSRAQGIRSVDSSRTSLKDMLRTADERWKSVPGYQSVLSKDWQPDMDSHVILAACQSNQTAQEVREGNKGVNGVFSTELVRVLKSTDCKEEMTYDGLFRLLKLPSDIHSQKPVIEGTQMFKPFLSRNPPRFWAVLIGIDAYEQHPLHHCVSDALSMKHFLTKDLGVPEHRIQCLLGPRDLNSTDPKSTPSHTNIIDTLYSLADNPEIERGDNIIIYYTGYAGTSCCTEHDRIFQCNDSCCIEALYPIDRDTQDKHGNWIPDISDRELNFLFALICRAKGHNITFIVDAHYWGRLGRGQLPRVGMVRPSFEANSMLHAADERWKDFPGYRSVFSNDWQPDVDSHVTLAAGFSVDGPREDGSYGGMFTDALLHVLKSIDWKEEMTYVDLINRMHRLLWHPPLVSGKRMKERIWN